MSWSGNQNFTIETKKILFKKLQNKIAKMPSGQECENLIKRLQFIGATLATEIYLKDLFEGSKRNDLPLTKIQQHKLNKLKRKI